MVELQGRFGEFEGIESEKSSESESRMGGGEEGARSDGDESSSGITGLNFEPMPEGGGNLAELAFGDEVEIEKDKWQIAVA